MLANSRIKDTIFIIFLAVAILIINSSYLRSPVAQWYRGNDFAHFYTSANEMLKGEDVYGKDLTPAMHDLGFVNKPRINQATNPPGLIFLTTALVNFSPATAFCLWTFFQLLFFATLLAALIMQSLGINGNSKLFFVSLVLLVVSNAFISHINYGQVQFLLAALILLGALSSLRGNKGKLFASFIYGLVSGLKVFTWPFVFLAIKISGKVGLLFFVLGLICPTLLSMIYLRPDQIGDFLTYAVPYIRTSAGEHSANLSLPHSVLWTLDQLGVVRAQNYYSLVTGLLAIAGFIYLALLPQAKNASNDSTLTLREASFFTCISLLLTPTMWPHYLVLLVLPLVILWADAQNRRQKIIVLFVYSLLALSNGRNIKTLLVVQFFQVWLAVVLLLIMACMLYRSCTKNYSSKAAG